ncbi:MAG: EAL domain-containing protein, partial [Sphingomonas sp.]|nr:EAL domain-containing protein [Sphingomonas sp.]
IGPISVTAFASREPHYAGAAFGLVAVAILTMRLLGVHGRHFNRVVRSRSDIAREQELAEDARYEAVVAATTDFLTGMPNRRAFVAALDVATSGGAECFAVALLDLDRFKAVNDTFGHTVGDQLLQEVAKKLLSALGSRGMVARLGGDEFGILLPSVRRAKDASAVGAELLTAISGPVIIQGREFVISGSCGMAISERRDEQSPSRLLADADLALYQAKENPGCGPAIFKLCMEAPRRRRAQIERALRLPSLAQNLGMVFQPIFDLESGQVTAIEALARWTDPELGRVGPSEFVPIAEQLNLIDGINQHLMGLAFEAAQTWPDHVKLAFNLSAVQLCSRGSAKAVLRALAAARLSPRRLQVEVTETALLADFERARENLTQLRQAGAAIVLDDFGAGYASIGYLRELQFDQIKLDGGLVTAAQHSTDGKRLLRAVVGLCEILGVATVAEHVEGPEALDLVTDLGCVCGQGFWLAVPMIAADLRSRLHTLCLPTAPCRQAA